jgi:hypothetical protein
MQKSNKNLVCGEGAVTATTESKKQEKSMEMKKMIDAYLDATSGNETDGTGTCRMCGKHYENNAYPVVVDERCCDDCNMLVAEMYWWIHWNHELLKGRVNNLLRNRFTTDFIRICLSSVAFTIYKDELTNKLDVVVVCEDEFIEKFVEVALQNWITDNCSDLNIEKVLVSSKAGARRVTNDMKVQFELEAKGEKTECYEETVVATKADEISERFEKVFESTDFQVDFVNDTSIEVSTITISRNSDEYIQIDIDDLFINITGYDNDNCCCEEGFHWCPESDDVDDLYEKIKNAVITVYAGITEYRMEKMFNN